MLTRPLVLVFASSFGFSTSFYLLLSVVPLYAASVGAGGRRSPWRGIWWTGLMTAVRRERSGVYLLLLYQSLNNRRLR